MRGRQGTQSEPESLMETQPDSASLMETKVGSLTRGWDSPLTDHRMNTDPDLIFDSCQLLSKTENLATARPLILDPRQRLRVAHSFCLHVFIFQEQAMQFSAQAPARPFPRWLSMSQLLVNC